MKNLFTTTSPTTVATHPQGPQSNSPWALWFWAIRPRTLLASVGPVLLGLSLAYTQAPQKFHPALAILTLLSCLFLQVAANLVNDYYDYLSGVDQSRRHGPLRLSQTGLITPIKIKRGYQLAFTLGTLIGLFLIYHGGLPILFIGLSSLLFAYAYTGGPIPLSHLGLGELLACIFFGPVAVGGTFYLQTFHFSGIILLVGLGPGLIAATLMAVNNLRDYQSDAIAGKKTLVVRWGEQRGRFFCLLLVLLASLIPILFMKITSFHFLLWSTALSALVFSSTWKGILKDKIGPQFNLYLAKTGQYLFFYSLLFSLGILGQS